MNSENLNNSRSYIIQAFYKLLKQKHFDKISVCEICEKAGVSRMSFYRNFESKENLSFYCVELVMDKIEQKCSALETVNTYTITKVFFETFRDFKDIIKSFENSDVSKNFINHVISKLKSEFPTDYMNKNSKYIPVFYFGAISTILIDWLKGGSEESPEEMARLVTSLISIDLGKKPLSPANTKILKASDVHNLKFLNQRENSKFIKLPKLEPNYN